MSNFGDVTFHKGIKDHKCIWDGEVIPKGKKMAHFKGMWEGEWQNWRMHEECYCAVQKAPYEILGEGFVPYAGKRGSAEER